MPSSRRRFTRTELAAGLMVIASFVWDFRVVLEERVPQRFNWPLYAAGMALGVGVFLAALARLRRNSRPVP